MGPRAERLDAPCRSERFGVVAAGCKSASKAFVASAIGRSTSADGSASPARYGLQIFHGAPIRDWLKNRRIFLNERLVHPLFHPQSKRSPGRAFYG